MFPPPLSESLAASLLSGAIIRDGERLSLHSFSSATGKRSWRSEGFISTLTTRIGDTRWPDGIDLERSAAPVDEGSCSTCGLALCVHERIPFRPALQARLVHGASSESLREDPVLNSSLDSQARGPRGSCLGGRVAAWATAPPESPFELRPGRRWPVDQPSRLRNANVAGMHAMPRRGAWPPTIAQHRAGMRWHDEALGPSC